MSEVIISKEFTFEASHVLPQHEGKCSKLHGHSWKLTVSVIGPIQGPNSFVADYTHLKHLVDTHIIQYLDHSHLGLGEAWHSPKYTGAGQFVNNFAETTETIQPYFGIHFYPSSENLVVAIHKVLAPLVKGDLGKDVELYEVALNETCTSRAAYRRCY